MDFIELMSDIKRRKMENIDLTDIDIETDEVLNLEEVYYQEGFQEGQEHGAKQQLMEGKEFGYQTGFQRFLIIGYITGLLEDWRTNIEKYGGLGNKSFENHLSQLEDLMKQVQLTNGDEEVATFEKVIGKARNKLRLLATLTKENWKISQVDSLVKEIGGQLQVSENVDDLW